MRYFLLLLTSVAGFVGGYVAGSIFGYRAAVADYVENDARTIKQMAETMYDTVDQEELPPGIKQAMSEARSETSDEDDGSDTGPAYQ
jgi:hypothetical protein